MFGPAENNLHEPRTRGQDCQSIGKLDNFIGHLALIVNLDNKDNFIGHLACIVNIDNKDNFIGHLALIVNLDN